MSEEIEGLKRQIADDALTIHTCEEIIDRVKKECGHLRARLSDCEKQLSRVEKERDEARELVRRMAFYNHKSFWEVDIARPYAGEKFTQPRTFVTDLEACQDAVKRWESEK